MSISKNEISENITSGQGKLIIELLEEIRDELKTLNENKEEENEEETGGGYDCDQCEETVSDEEPYKTVNKFTFCSWKC